MDAERHYKHLDRLDRERAIRAIHQAYLQLVAVSAAIDCAPFDNEPAIAALLACLREAGRKEPQYARPTPRSAGDGI